MPWQVKKSDQCPISKPWGVVKEADGKVVPGGCHGSRKDALAHAAALYANEKEAPHVNRTAQFLSRQQVRVTHATLRDMEERTGKFIATVLRYNTEDDFGSEMAPKMFDESLRARLPRVVWGHDWTDPIGKYTDYQDTAHQLDLVGQLDMGMIDRWSIDGETLLSSIPAVPRAHQAYAQMASGTIDQFSVGFWPQDGHEVKRSSADGDHYVFRFTKGRLDEASLVLVGAVPGTEMLALRHSNRPVVIRAPQPVISKDAASAIMLDLHTGRIDLADALMAIKQSAVEGPAEPTTESDPAEPAVESDDGAGEGGDDSGEVSSPPPEPEPEVTVEEPEPEPQTEEVAWLDFEDVEGILTARLH